MSEPIIAIKGQDVDSIREDLRILNAALVDAMQTIMLARELIQRIQACELRSVPVVWHGDSTFLENTPPVKNGDTPHTINVSAIPAEGHL